MRSSLRAHDAGSTRARRRASAMTTMRSPGRMRSSPRGTTCGRRGSGRRPASRRGMAALRSARPTSAFARRVGAARRTRRSAPCRRRTRRCGARTGCRGRPTIAFAVSSSGEIMKSTSIWPSRHASRYAPLVVRMIVLRAGDALDEHRADEVGLLARAAADEQVGLLDAGLGRTLLRRRRRPRRCGRRACRRGPASRCGVQVDHRDVVLLVQRVHDRAPDIARAEHDDVHGASVSAGRDRG